MTPIPLANPMLALADDLRPRLKDADDLSWRSGLGPEHASTGLAHDLTTMRSSAGDRAGEPADAAPPMTSHLSQLLLRRLRRSLGLAYRAARDAAAFDTLRPSTTMRLQSHFNRLFRT